MAGLGEETVLCPRVSRAGGIDAPDDVVLSAVKATRLEQAVDGMAAEVGPHSLVVPVLNGVRHVDILAARFGHQAVLVGVLKVFLAALGAMTCRMCGSVGEAAAVPGGTAFARQVVDECASVAAEGGHLVPAPALRQTPTTVTEAGSASTSSLCRDVTANRSAEAEHIYGDLVLRAHRLGLTVPLLDLATRPRSSCICSREPGADAVMMTPP
ncbi:ketopantoate reductase family protein [Streptomyces sp. NPDC090798]|uniref:ketopantoate reductase family protein n=1 Tax=Streptomyces sp. NPDC090798 TaxID=3365968 RepID=UPI0037FDF004